MNFPDAILFDLDGTLIDSFPDVCASLNRVFAEEGLPLLGQEAVETLAGNDTMTMIENALSAGGNSIEKAAEIHPRFLANYRAHPVENTKIYPGVIEALEGFAAADTPMGICTNKPRATAEAVLDALDMSRYFQVVSCGDAPYKKPDGRHILMTLEVMKAEISCSVFVGDNETDMAAARDAGIKSIAVTYGYRSSKAEDLDADVLIDSFHDLADALEILERKPTLP